MKLHESDKKRLKAITDHLPNISKQERADLTRAYLFAKNAHRGQKRFSGKPYFFHVYHTGLTLAELHMDVPTIMAGLLHDTAEDTDATFKQIEEEFGAEVRFLVHGVTKLGKVKYQGLKRHTESLRKLLLAMSRDIRVLIIKLADRLHNMRTLSHVPEHKRKRIALETLEIYAPLAHRLGIGRLKGELEDLAFPHLYPDEYETTKQLLKEKSRENIKRLRRVARILLRLTAEEKIAVDKTDYRIKRLYSLYKKLERYDMNIDQIYDIAALRVIVPSIGDCYRVLGIIHNRWTPLPGRIKDYIAAPKTNGYQSLHTTIFTGDGSIVEIQIRTPEMHEEAEFGIASHVSYKEGVHADDQAWLTTLMRTITRSSAEEPDRADTSSPPWLREAAELQKDVEDPEQFLDNLMNDFFDERVIVFTPKGEVIDLPRGATAIDFAYAIHTDIGHTLSGAKIHGKLVSLDQPLKHGDIVEIETSKNARPRSKWLDHAKTTSARRRIRQALEDN